MKPVVASSDSGRRPLRYVVAMLLGASMLYHAACGGDNGDNSESQSLPIRGGDRLVWNQGADSLAQLNALSYRLYVDNARSTLANVRCTNTSTAAGYECSGGLPPLSGGRHTLELTSVLNGVESARSAPLTVTMTASAQLAPSIPLANLGSSIDGQAACVTESRTDTSCYDVRIVATGLGAVTTLDMAPDGRLLFVEEKKAVRVLTGNGVLDSPALALIRPDEQIVGLAIDPDFTNTGFVFVAWTEVGRDGRATLNLTRYRQLQNVFGEAATIVSGLPFVQDALAPLAVDANGWLYVALPSVEGSDSGMVARFTRDGLVPRENPTTSPLVATGYSMPTALAIDARHGWIWLAGDHASWPEAVATFAVPTTPAEWPIRPIRIGPTRPQGQDHGPLLAAAKRLFKTSLTFDGTPGALEEVRLIEGVEVLAATEDVNGNGYVVVVDDANVTSILVLTRQ